MRRDTYEMFIVYQTEFQYRWNKIISAGFESFTGELRKLAKDFSVSQTIHSKIVICKNGNEEIEILKKSKILILKNVILANPLVNMRPKY